MNYNMKDLKNYEFVAIGAGVLGIEALLAGCRAGRQEAPRGYVAGRDSDDVPASQTPSVESAEIAPVVSSVSVSDSALTSLPDNTESVTPEPTIPLEDITVALSEDIQVIVNNDATVSIVNSESTASEEASQPVLSDSTMIYVGGTLISLVAAYVLYKGARAVYDYFTGSTPASSATMKDTKSEPSAAQFDASAKYSEEVKKVLDTSLPSDAPVEKGYELVADIVNTPDLKSSKGSADRSA